MQNNKPLLHRWTRREYDRMTNKGLFEGKRVEMIYGVIFKKDRQSPAHSRTLSVLQKILDEGFGRSQYTVFQQNQIRLLKNSDPEPDVYVAVGELDSFTDHPRHAVLVVEVSHSDRDLAFSRTHKAALYARAGIKDYWIVNLMNFQLEIFREPVQIGEKKFDYSKRAILLPNETVSPLALPELTIAVRDILPPESWWRRE